MIFVEQHNIKEGHKCFNICSELCIKSKNLYNFANYIVRQEFIKTSKEKQEGLREHANYLNYYEINKILKDNKEYCSLPRKVSNQTLMLLDKNWKSFFSSIKDWGKNPNKYNGKPSLPKYLKKDGKYLCIYELGAISSKELRKGIVKLSGTDIRLTTKKTNIKQVRIIPRNLSFVIEIVYEKEEGKLKEDNGRYGSIDFGLNNLATVSSNVVKPYIINGKVIKSINHYYNKKLAKKKSILEKRNGKKSSKGIKKLTDKRNNKIKNYFHKSTTYIINQLVSQNINTLIVGYNKEWKQEINIGKRNNQNFVNIPHELFTNMLSYKCKFYGINFIKQEESYTSKTSFLDNEPIHKHEEYQGRRIKRGLFKSSEGKLINSDVNGSLNILRKAFPNAFGNGIQGITVSPMVITLP
jgi:putative transposase